MPQLTLEAHSEAKVALANARERLLSLQDDAGWWRGELQTNVTMDAEDMLLREFLGIRRADETERSAAWIRSQQRADGTWANFHGGPGELSTTIEAYWALRLAGDSAQDAHMRAAAEFIRREGGLERARVFTHVWLALFGLWSWERVPALPPEIVLLPPSVPLNVYDFACWARQTIVALSIVKAHRPIRSLPFDLEELRADGPPQADSSPRRSRRAISRRAVWLSRLDRLLRAYEHRPLAPLRRLALAKAERWIVRRQEADGSWGGIQPPWVYSLMALHLAGYPLEHPVVRRGLEGLDRFMVEDRDDSRGVGAPGGESRRLEACQSPVWDTALAMVALGDAGVAEDHPAMLAGARWLLGEEVVERGDWSVRRPDLEAGGWAFEFANVNYPDVDDTVEVVLALARLAGRQPLRAPIDGAIGRALRWVEGMQSSDGGWAAFDADNTLALVRELPFLDFGEVIDEPSADVTAHTVEMLGVLGLDETPAARSGVRWLVEHQEPDGSWFGRWGINHVYGTGAALPGLIAAGVDPADACIRRAVSWLERHQNEDGGWGEDPRSYDDPSWIGRGASTASQTAWALLALHAAGERSPALARGIAWLVSTQRADGGWDEPQYTGTGFPSDYYINYHLYRLTFPIMALGRCLAVDAGQDAQQDARGERAERQG
ncbi:MAG: squalene--hopene cyclase [Solirubrobacteraceae bacterium]